jgi:hypothetical protein
MNNKPDNYRPKTNRKVVIVGLIVLIAGALVAYWLWYTSQNKRDDTGSDMRTDFPTATLQSIASGKILSQQYCRSCHMLPDPALLNRFKWKNVFPQMGLRMGIKTHRGESYAGTI